MKKIKSIAMIIGLATTFAACEKSVATVETTSNEKTDIVKQMKSSNANSKLARPQSWADCLMFDGVVTPATFKPESDPFDELYVNNLGIGYRDGKPLISDSKPGDADYNGGRWHMNVIKGTVDAGKYANACTVEDLDLNDFMSTDNYFECPLLPRK